jgi:hypothetical protein
MTAFPKQKRAPAKSALRNAELLEAYHSAQRLQGCLARRIHRTASISELMPLVLIITLAQGTGSYGGHDSR